MFSLFLLFNINRKNKPEILTKIIKLFIKYLINLNFTIINKVILV